MIGTGMRQEGSFVFYTPAYTYYSNNINRRAFSSFSCRIWTQALKPICFNSGSLTVLILEAACNIFPTYILIMKINKKIARIIDLGSVDG